MLLSDILTIEACAAKAETLYNTSPLYCIYNVMLLRLATFSRNLIQHKPFVLHIQRDVAQACDFSRSLERLCVQLWQEPKIDRNTFRASQERESSCADGKHVCVCVVCVCVFLGTARLWRLHLNYRSFPSLCIHWPGHGGGLCGILRKPHSQNSGFKGLCWGVGFRPEFRV